MYSHAVGKICLGCAPKRSDPHCRTLVYLMAMDWPLNLKYCLPLNFFRTTVSHYDNVDEISTHVAEKSNGHRQMRSNFSRAATPTIMSSQCVQ